MLEKLGEVDSRGLNYKTYMGLYPEEISEVCEANKESMIIVFCGFHSFFKENSKTLSTKNMKPENKELWEKHKNLYFYFVALSQTETYRYHEYVEMCKEQNDEYIKFIKSGDGHHWLYSRFTKDFQYEDETIKETINTVGTEQKLCDALLDGLKQNELNYVDCYIYNYPCYFDIERGKMIYESNPLVRNITPTYNYSPLCISEDKTHVKIISTIEFDLVKDGRRCIAPSDTIDKFLKYDKNTFSVICQLHEAEQKVIELENEIKNKYVYEIKKVIK